MRDCVIGRLRIDPVICNTDLLPVLTCAVPGGAEAGRLKEWVWERVACGMIVHLENLRDSSDNHHSERRLRKMAGYKIPLRTTIAFLLRK